MKKEDYGVYFNSQSGKVNIMLLFSIVLIFVVMLWGVNAFSITINAPTNLTYNGSRNINISFTPVWSLANENVSNCTIYTNVTNSSGNVWDNVRNFSTLDTFAAGSTSNISNNTISWANFTYTGDGNFTFNIGCYTSNNTGTLQFSGGSTGSGNRTFFIDSLAPNLVLEAPQGTLNFGGASPNIGPHNITSYATAAIYVNVSDNSTFNVFYILNSGSSLDPTTANESTNRSMTLGTVISPHERQYYANLTSLFNFNSTFTSPGPHSVFFCANDSFARQTCSNRVDFIIKGMNVTQMEGIFTTMQQGAGGVSFGGLNITLGNGTEIPTDTFMNPVTGVTVEGVTHKNFTFIINITNQFIVHIVAGRIDESQFANASNARVNNTPTPEIRNQLGSRDTPTMAWADIGSFIPSEVSYEYGILQLGGTSYSKKMYCNGTTMSDPQCHLISQCNATVFGIYNHSIVIPPNDACWLESGTINTQALTAGFTYIFVDHFSGGLGGSDFSQINVTFNGATVNGFNTSVALNKINVTLEDLNSTGLNLTRNNSINVTVYADGTQVAAFFNYTTGSNSGSRLTCTSADTVSQQNTTSVTCNATFAFSNGTYVIAVTARDTSNNTNPVNITVGNITIKVDQIPPKFDYYNFTDQRLNGTSSGEVDKNVNVTQLNQSAGYSRAQGDAVSGKIFAYANWTDNLTQPLRGLLQFYNETKGASGQDGWQTINESVNNTPDYRAFQHSNWINFTWGIPKGHNEFEGRNVSFRIIANDTIGNVNTSTVKNFTIQINDTTVPSIIINGTIGTNNTNTSSTSVSVVSWAVNEQNKLSEINISVDGAVNNDDGCTKFKRLFVVSGPNNVESNRNASFSTSTDPSCTLGNGSHSIKVTALDTWGNLEVVFHNFTVTSGVTPTISLVSTVFNSSTFSAVNKTSVRSDTGINFSALVGPGGTLSTMSFTSSCNSTGGTFTNNSAIKPFGGSCVGASANRTVSVTATDHAGNSVTTLFQFNVDDVAPSIAVWSPTQSSRLSNNVSLNWSVKDDSLNISFTGYFLDNNPLPVALNQSGAGQGTTSINFSDSRSINFTAGTHTIKFTANDSLGNFVNSSAITFTVDGPINFLSLLNGTGGSTTSLTVYNTNISFINLTNASGAPLEDTRNVADQTLNLLMSLNTSPGVLTNLTLVFNASAANWDKYNFSVKYLNSSHTSDVASSIVNNQSAKVLQMITFNDSISDFLPDAGYYGTVKLLMNASGTDIGSTVKIQWYENTSYFKNPTNITICPSTFAPSSPTSTSGMPCWNNTNNQSITVFVSHFSHIVVANETPPSVTVNVPASLQYLISFTPNITVSDDTKNCTYSYNASNAQSSQISMTLEEQQSVSTCVGSVITNLTNGTQDVNITFYVYDTSNNLNQTSFSFVVNDTALQTASVTISGVGSTSATVSVTANESVNMSVNSTGSTSFTNPSAVTSFATTQTISLSSLTASTTYNLTVKTCDRAGNCLLNTTLGFTTSAAAAEAAAAAAAATTGGGGGGAVAPSAEVASASRRWDSLEAGSSGVLTINNAEIAVTGVVVDVKNALTNAEIKIASLSSNPLSTAAAANVYQYLQLTKANIADADASKITINFRVPKTWLTSNGIAETDVVLYRYSDSKWNALPTTKTGDDANNVLYQSTTPGFSTFAIGGKEAAPAEAPPTEAVPAPEAPAAAPEAPVAPTPAEEKPAEAKGLSSTAIAWIVVVIIVVVAGIGYYMWQKKKAE